MLPSTASKSKNVLCLLIPIVLFWLGAVLFYPIFSQSLQPDSISYLTIANRYLQGDYANAINGYWSPLNIWLLVAYVKLSNSALEPAAYIINCVAFTGFIIVSIKLAMRFLQNTRHQMLLGIVLSILCLFQIPVTLFADALGSFLMLLAIFIMSKDKFLSSIALWIAWSIILTLAAYSKIYALYILPLILLIYLLHTYSTLRNRTIILPIIKMLTISSGIVTLLMLPWMYLLHQKYGVWMLSSAGKINSSWSIMGHVTFSPDIKTLIPPAIKGGINYWEDPWQHHGILVTPFRSLTYFKGQLYRILMNVISWVQVVSAFSPFYIPIWMGGMLFFFRNSILSNKLITIIIAYCLFPIGYWLTAVQSRYLLVTVPLIMIIGFFFIEKYVAKSLSKQITVILIIVYCASWVPGSIAELKSRWGEGSRDKATAQKLKELGIKGSFLTNSFENYPTSFRLSWYSGNTFYMHYGNGATTTELLQDATRYGIRYYFYYYNDIDSTITDGNLLKIAGMEITRGQIPGLKIFKLSSGNTPSAP